MKLIYKTDICHNEILQDENNTHQVMMEWEKPYMEACIDLLDPSGRVLEIGFGLGYSAAVICNNKNVNQYTVIECSPTVWKKFEEFKAKYLILRPDLEIKIIKGRWQDVLCEADIYDSIFFDDYESDVKEENFFRFNKFLYTILLNHSKIGTKISCYSTQKIQYNINCLKTELYEMDIKIPEYCNYAKGDKMYIPIIEKAQQIDLNKEELKNYLIPKFDQNYCNLNYLNNYNNNKQIYCNLLILDNFYNNAIDTRNFILTQEFNVTGNFSGKRTKSYATDELKNIIEKYLIHFAGKITEWDNSESSYNGAFQYNTSRDLRYISNNSSNNWMGILFLNVNNCIDYGLNIYKFKNQSLDEKNNYEMIMYDQDYSKWYLVDKVGNIFNRLVLFNSKEYHYGLDYFGIDKNNASLFQVFFFSTER